MKTPQRKFVVEFKSGRRLPKSGANSIWGDTDFNALAREVEDQSSHLFGAASPAVQAVTEPTLDAGSLIPAGERVMEDVVPEAPMNPVVDSAESPVSTPAVIDEVAEPVPTPIEPPTVSSIVKAPKKAPRKRVARVLATPVPTAKDEPQVPTVNAVTASTAADDLATLDAENKRLRQLLANQLRAQNAELKRMLERF